MAPCSDSVGKQHVRKPGRGRRRVTFADVAGIDSAKLELSECLLRGGPDTLTAGT